MSYFGCVRVGSDLFGSSDLFLEFESTKWPELSYNVSVVGGFSPRGGRGATWTFAGRVGSPGIFNAWLPHSTPTGVGGTSALERCCFTAVEG